jgi:glutamyl-tRNA reductase
MHYLIISFSHKNTNVTIREKFAFTDEQKKDFMQNVTNDIASEVIFISTCNRVELFLYANNIEQTKQKIFELFVEFGLDDVDFSIADIFVDKQAIHHLFEVMCSLDSLVVGETQIAGQVKSSFSFAYENGFCHKHLARAMHRAFRVSSMVREQTHISKKPVSIASVAVAKAKDILDGNLGGFSALVVGTGEMSRLAAKNLARLGVNVIVFNRTIEKAKELAHELGSTATYKPLSSLKDYVNKYRLLFTATSSKDPIITNDMIRDVEFERHWFDIAIPRDICVGVDHPQVNVYAVDDLQDIANKNKSIRDEEAKIARGIIGGQTVEFFDWIQTLSVDPLIKEIRKHAKDSALTELSRAVKKGYIPARFEKDVEKFLHSVFNRFLHDCTINLKQIANTDEADVIVQSLRKVMGFEDNEKSNVNRYKCEHAMGEAQS